MAPNPALPKDQPLRGRWCKTSVCFTPPLHRLYKLLRGSWHNASVLFTPTTQLSHQPLRSRWRNTYVCFTPPPHQSHQQLRGRRRIVCVCFIPPPHRLYQPLRGRWCNTVILSANRKIDCRCDRHLMYLCRLFFHAIFLAVKLVYHQRDGSVARYVTCRAKAIHSYVEGNHQCLLVLTKA